MNTIAEQIKDAVTVPDAFERYGFTPNRGGFIPCPFHREKTASLRAYADGRKWKCFGCGEGGTVIDFIMGLFGLDYDAAVRQINTDFGLNLFDTPKLSAYRKMQKKTNDMKKKRAQEDAKKRYNRYTWNQMVEFIRWLRQLPDSVHKTHDLAHMDRLTERFLSPDIEIPFDIDALIAALKSKYETEVEN